MSATEKIFGRPGHAYTKMLLDSVPQLHRKWVAREPEAETTDEMHGVEHAVEHGVIDAAPRLVEVESDHFVASD